MCIRDSPMTGWKNNFRNIFIEILAEKLNVEKERIIEEELKDVYKRQDCTRGN